MFLSSSVPFLVAAALAFVVAWRMRRRSIALAALAAITGAVSLTWGGYVLWYHHRGTPDPIPERPIFRGITYERIVRTSPRPIVLHVARIDLTAGGIEPFVTPPDRSAGRDTRGKKTSAFLEDHDLQLAVNGGFFYPFHSDGPFDYYPHPGDPVSIIGVTASDGARYGDPDPDSTVLAFFPGPRAVMTASTSSAPIAISGAPRLVEGGLPIRSFPSLRHPIAPEPRTAVALDRERRILGVIVVDGRQPSHSEGITLAELAAVIVELGFADAVNLDGGGSSALVREHDGAAELLSTPIHGRVPPGVERPVANHLGFKARRLD
jgi:hypothetical protein